MGMISDELEQKLQILHGVLSAPARIPVPGAGLMTANGFPVVGMALAQTEQLVSQMNEIAKALKLVSATVRKLEDKIKTLENTNAATGRPLPPVGFRK